jgi:phosphoenolpyruvate-protein phosphotransferase
VTSNRLALVAPLAGWVLPLEEVPDPVFAGGMAGVGVAIDPTADTLHAPCAGEVVTMPGGRHAVMLRTAQGAEVLLHVGIDTVQMAGAGFAWLVEPGQQVAAGAALLRFDLEAILRRARSAVTPVVLAGGATGRLARQGPGRAVAVGDFLCELELDAKFAPATAAADAGGRSLEAQWRVTSEHGLHARPAALIAASLKDLGAQVSILAHGRTANARSVVALMSLGVREGEVIAVRARGRDAPAAIAALARLFSPVESPRPPVAIVPIPGRRRIQGVIGARGLAVGALVRMEAQDLDILEQGRGTELEWAALQAALGEVARHLEALASHAASERRSIVLAHRELVADPELRRAAGDWIAKGKSAAFGWRSAMRASIAGLLALDDRLLAERAADLRDLEGQVLRVLAGLPPSAARQLPEYAIVVADELLPSQLLSVEPGQIAGLCTARGGPTSHVALLAAAMGIPALVAAGRAVLEVPAGTPVVLDAEQGFLDVDPGEESLARGRAMLAGRARRASEELAASAAPAVTRDGIAIAVYCNIGSLAEATDSVARGAEGCGLLRSEFLFLDRREPPGEDEQVACYGAIAHALGGRTLTVRTLDVGGDKPIAYLPLPQEDNPALGLRGVRTSLWRPELLRTQLRAVLRVAAVAQCRILLPMVTDIDELRAVRAELDRLAAELDLRSPPLGVMIETPASALLADQLVAEAEFLSIGSNDLSQYTLAMDRTHAELARSLDALHPAVLRLIARTAQAAAGAGRHVAVCGGLASDLVAVPILIGLGIRELSVVPSFIPRAKALLRALNVEAAARLARQALEARSAPEVRAMAERFAELGLGSAESQ